MYCATSPTSTYLSSLFLELKLHVGNNEKKYTSYFKCTWGALQLIFFHTHFCWPQAKCQYKGGLISGDFFTLMQIAFMTAHLRVISFLIDEIHTKDSDLARYIVRISNIEEYWNVGSIMNRKHMPHLLQLLWKSVTKYRHMRKNHNYGLWFIYDYSVFFEKRKVHFDQLHLRLSCLSYCWLWFRLHWLVLCDHLE